MRLRADRIRTLEEAKESKSGPYRPGEQEFTPEDWLRIQSQGLLSIHTALDSLDLGLKKFLKPFPGVYKVWREIDANNGGSVYCGSGSDQLPEALTDAEHLRYGRAIELLVHIMSLHHSIANHPAAPNTLEQALVLGVLYERWRLMPFYQPAESGVKSIVGGEQGREILENDEGHQEDLRIQKEERDEMTKQYWDARAKLTRRSAAYHVAEKHGRSKQNTYRYFLDIDPC